MSLDWAATQNNGGLALERLDERESGTARLAEAVTAYRAALEVFVPAGADYYINLCGNNLTGRRRFWPRETIISFTHIAKLKIFGTNALVRRVLTRLPDGITLTCGGRVIPAFHHYQPCSLEPAHGAERCHIHWLDAGIL